MEVQHLFRKLSAFASELKDRVRPLLPLVALPCASAALAKPPALGQLPTPWKPSSPAGFPVLVRVFPGSCVRGTDDTLASLGKGLSSCSGAQGSGLIPFPGAASSQEDGNQQLAKINQSFSLWTDLVWHQKSQRPPSASSRGSKESRRGDPAGSRISPGNEPADSYRPGFPSAASRHHEGVPRAKMGCPCEMWGPGAL